MVKPREPGSVTQRFIASHGPKKPGSAAGKHPPPPIPKRMPRAPVDTGETPVVLDPKAQVRIAKGLGEKRLEAPAGDAKKGLREMDLNDLKALLQAAKVLGGKENLSGLSRIIALATGRREGGSAYYMAIRTDDGRKWRLYEFADNLASIEKFELCKYVATLEENGRLFFLYLEK